MFNIQHAEEFLHTGNIVQDSDTSIDWPERERRFNRYIELLDSIEGTEGIQTAQLIIRSMRARDDYGAYQTAQHALFRFPSTVTAAALVLELPDMIRANREWAGEILCGLANEITDIETPYVDSFCAALHRVSGIDRSNIEEFILEQEDGIWLKHRVGVLRAKPEAEPCG